ncbi:MAG TPA: hypothetical protein VK002_11920 [Rubricoccaceae bacterium]|jgi:uncharacterized membrane protein YeaQ/YmgE (transglycosylase-associated protein family)|nr:hypothetical protein [Rubricoccaceae bacterium]
MDPLVWIGVGLGVGFVAALVAQEEGLFGDLLFGLLGAFLGGWLVDLLYVAAPLDGLAGTAPAALVGAALFVLLLRLVHRATVAPIP